MGGGMVNANAILDKLRWHMSYADEFEPDDIDAAVRSITAKAHAKAAQMYAMQGRDSDAIREAEIAIRIIEGN